MQRGFALFVCVFICVWLTISACHIMESQQGSLQLKSETLTTKKPLYECCCYREPRSPCAYYQPLKDRFEGRRIFLRPDMKIIFVLCSGGMAFASKLRYIIRKRLHMIKEAELWGLCFDYERHKVILHELTRGNVILCTGGDLYHLKSLSFLYVICEILSCFDLGRRLISHRQKTLG